MHWQRAISLVCACLLLLASAGAAKYAAQHLLPPPLQRRRVVVGRFCCLWLDWRCHSASGDSQLESAFFSARPRCPAGLCRRHAPRRERQCTPFNTFDFLELVLQWPPTNCEDNSCTPTQDFFTLHGGCQWHSHGAHRFVADGSLMPPSYYWYLHRHDS